MSLPLIVTCRCLARYRVRPELIGRHFRCRRCRRILRIPAESAPTVRDQPPGQRVISQRPVSSSRFHSPWLTASGGFLVGLCLAAAWGWASPAARGDVQKSFVQTSAQKASPDALLVAVGAPASPHSGMSAPADGSRLELDVPALATSRADSLPTELELASPNQPSVPMTEAPQPAEDSASAAVSETEPPATIAPPATPLPISDGPIAATFEEAKSLSRQLERPILLFFMSERCPWCRKLRSETLTHPAARNATRKFICVDVNADDRANAALRSQYGGRGVPTYAVTDSTGRLILSGAGFQPDPKELAMWLDHTDVWRSMNESTAALRASSAPAGKPASPAKSSASSKRKSSAIRAKESAKRPSK